LLFVSHSYCKYCKMGFISLEESREVRTEINIVQNQRTFVI